MTNKQTSTKTPDMTRILQKNNKLIKGNMKMNAELIEAISALSKAVEGLQTGDSSSATSPATDDTAVLPVHLYMLLDRSGSMSGWEQDVIGGFNTFIKEQQKENLREIQRMCGMDRPPRAAETWMMLSTALRKEPPAKPPRPWGGFKNDDDDDDAESQTSTLPEQPTAALASDVAKLARERALRNPGLFSADGLFAPTEEPDFEFDGDGELDELTSADFGEDPYLHVDT